MKTACEIFRENLEYLSKLAHKYEQDTGEKYYEHPGEILQMFDEIHQSCRENTGDKCKSIFPQLPNIIVDLLREVRKSISEQDEVETACALGKLAVEFGNLRDKDYNNLRRDMIAHVHEAIIFTPLQHITLKSIDGLDMAIRFAFREVDEENLDKVIDTLQQFEWELVPVEKMIGEVSEFYKGKV
jgi:hypothetical protein